MIWFDSFAKPPGSLFHSLNRSLWTAALRTTLNFPAAFSPLGVVGYMGSP